MHFWFSRQQFRCAHGGHMRAGPLPAPVPHRMFARLEDGRVVEYTEAKAEREPACAWPDAEYLGEGRTATPEESADARLMADSIADELQRKSRRALHEPGQGTVDVVLPRGGDAPRLSENTVERMREMLEGLDRAPDPAVACAPGGTKK